MVESGEQALDQTQRPRKACTGLRRRYQLAGIRIQAWSSGVGQSQCHLRGEAGVLGFTYSWACSQLQIYWRRSRRAAYLNGTAGEPQSNRCEGRCAQTAMGVPRTAQVSLDCRIGCNIPADQHEALEPTDPHRNLEMPVGQAPPSLILPLCRGRRFVAAQENGRAVLRPRATCTIGATRIPSRRAPHWGTLAQANFVLEAFLLVPRC